MTLAITGSRNLNINIDEYMPEGVVKLITGGAKGIDQLGEEWARRNGIELEIIRPDYENYHYKSAPLIRNKTIVEKADKVIAFWDGKSRGTKFTIDYAKKLNKPLIVYTFEG